MRCTALHGGTIGMVKNKDGVYVPVAKKFFEKLKHNPQTHYQKFVDGIDLKPNQLLLPKVNNFFIVYELKEYCPLLDSSNMTPKEWIRIARDIDKLYCDFNGFVVLHGTDTLAYTASALSFLLEGIEKPVIVTGSQLSIFEPRNDALRNIISSIIISGCCNIPEVCVFFGNKLMRGNRTVKISSSKFDAFVSPNYPVLGEVDAKIMVRDNTSKFGNTFKLHTNLNENVGLFILFPSISPEMLDGFIGTSMAGLILLTYGSGNICSNRYEIIDILKKAVERDVLVVNVTQCLHGTVGAVYGTGKVLAESGIVPGFDMTTEAALTKMCYVLGSPNLSYSERVELMKQNIRGELTNNCCSN